MHPEDSDSLYKSYLEATERPHGYLILDFAQGTNDRLRYRTNVFPDEYPPIIYMPTKTGDEADKTELSRSSDPKLRKAILANCKSELVKTLSECSLNLLRCNVKLTPC